MLETTIPSKLMEELKKTNSGRYSLQIWRQAEVLCFERKRNVPSDFECKIDIINGLLKIRFDLENLIESKELAEGEFELFKMMFEDLADVIRNLNDDSDDFAFVTHVKPKTETQLISEITESVSNLKMRIEYIHQLFSEESKWPYFEQWAHFIQVKLENIRTQLQESVFPELSKEKVSQEGEVLRLNARIKIICEAIKNRKKIL